MKKGQDIDIEPLAIEISDVTERSPQQSIFTDVNTKSVQQDSLEDIPGGVSAQAFPVTTPTNLQPKKSSVEKVISNDI